MPERASRIFYKNGKTSRLELAEFTNKVKYNLIIVSKIALLFSLGAKLEVNRHKFIKK